jgi:hypothetical protein
VGYCAHQRAIWQHVGRACHRRLRAWGDGDDGALEQLRLLVEAELRGWRECTYAASGAAYVADYLVTAEVLHVSTDTVKRDWRLATLCLLKELEREGQ